MRQTRSTRQPRCSPGPAIAAMLAASACLALVAPATRNFPEPLPG